MKEKVEVQRQAEKENSDLLKQVKLLEVELEEQVNRVMELESTRTTESGDLRQQIQALEKQLEKNRKFLDVSDDEKTSNLVYRLIVYVIVSKTKQSKKNFQLLKSEPMSLCEPLLFLE